MTKRLMLLLAAALPAVAGPVVNCAGGTLADYIALGSDGCQLGFYRVFGFQETSLSFGADPIAPTDVTILPATGANFGSLNFSAMIQSLTTALESAFLYSVAGPVSFGSLTLDQATASGTGVTLVLQEFCVGGDFSSSACSGTTVSQTVFQVDGDQELAMQSSIGAQLANIRQSIVADAGPMGSATFGTATATFTVPEPGSALLAACALASLRLIRRHCRS